MRSIEERGYLDTIDVLNKENRELKDELEVFISKLRSTRNNARLTLAKQILELITQGWATDDLRTFLAEYLEYLEADNDLQS